MQMSFTLQNTWGHGHWRPTTSLFFLSVTGSRTKCLWLSYSCSATSPPPSTLLSVCVAVTSLSHPEGFQFQFPVHLGVVGRPVLSPAWLVKTESTCPVHFPSVCKGFLPSLNSCNSKELSWHRSSSTEELNTCVFDFLSSKNHWLPLSSESLAWCNDIIFCRKIFPHYVSSKQHIKDLAAVHSALLKWSTCSWLSQ